MSRGNGRIAYCIGYIVAIDGRNLALSVCTVIQMLFCFLHNRGHHGKSLNRIFAHSGLTGKPHGIQHLGCDYNRLTGLVAFLYNPLLDKRYLLGRNLNSHIAPGNHDSIAGFNDVI